MDLPLNGRSYFSLVALSPNVTTGFVAPAQASGRLGGSRGSLTIAVTGGRTTWENYTLDGITNTDIDFNTYILQPSVDALQEFKVQSGIYPAEFGRELGQVNAATKPGTNEYHGAVWEFLRNDKLDAVPYDFASATRGPGNPPPVKAPYKQNQYGYELGGPVRIPKLFNGKNRLFFMSNFEEYNSRQTTPALITTMPAAMRNGDFSSILSCRVRALRPELAQPRDLHGIRPTVGQRRRDPDSVPRQHDSRQPHQPGVHASAQQVESLAESASDDGRIAFPQLSIWPDDSARQGHAHHAHRFQRELQIAVVRPL